MAKQFFNSLPAMVGMKRQNRRGHKNELVLSIIGALIFRQFVYVPSLKANLGQTNIVDPNGWTDSLNS